MKLTQQKTVSYFTKYKDTYYIKPYLKGNKSNVLIIGDLHAPFTHKQYLQFVRHQQELYKCGTVIFIGDIVDFHYSSFHDTDPDGLSAKEEHSLSGIQLEEWYKMFPNCYCVIGNHDAIIKRKCFANGISTNYLKDWNDLFNAPKGWKFVDEIIIKGILYTHGTNKALKRMMDSRISVVQGHLHTESYVIYSQSEVNRLFGMQVGCGIDNKSYAFAYAKSFNKKPVISCGIILDNGKLPFIVTL